MNYKTNMNQSEVGACSDAKLCYWDETHFDVKISKEQAINAFKKTLADKDTQPYNIERMIELFKTNLDGAMSRLP